MERLITSCKKLTTDFGGVLGLPHMSLKNFSTYQPGLKFAAMVTVLCLIEAS